MKRETTTSGFAELRPRGEKRFNKANMLVLHTLCIQMMLDYLPEYDTILPLECLCSLV